MERRVETKEVKKALQEAGYTGIKVGHGTGTARGWLHITVAERNRTDIITIAQKVTGRHGDYDGCINTF